MGISFAMVAHNYYDSSRVSRCSSSPREGQPEFTWPTPERGSKSAAAKENLQSTRQKAKLSRSLLWISSPVFGLLRARYLEQCPLALSFSFISFFDSVSFFFFFQWKIPVNYTLELYNYSLSFCSQWMNRYNFYRNKNWKGEMISNIYFKAFGSQEIFETFLKCD